MKIRIWSSKHSLREQMECKEHSSCEYVHSIYRVEQVSLGVLPTRSPTTLLGTESAAYA